MHAQPPPEKPSLHFREAGLSAIHGVMWLNQQTIDAIRMMAALTRKWPAFVKAADLSALTGVSVMNVQKTAHALGVAGLVETARGRHGGLRIGRAADAISVGDIVRAFEPKDCPVNFLSTADANDAVSRLLFRAHRGFFAPLEGTTLFDLDIPVLTADAGE